MLEHITKTLFHFIVIWKMASMLYILYRAIQLVVGGYQTWAVNRMGRTVHSIFVIASCELKLLWGRGIVVKQKDVFPVSVRTDFTDALLQFV
jgi:hypothetical protein